MKKYRLLKDLPGYAAGTIFISQPPYGYRPENNGTVWTFHLPSCCMNEQKDWFTEVQEKGYTEDDMIDLIGFVHGLYCKNRVHHHDKSVLNVWLEKRKSEKQ